MPLARRRVLLKRSRNSYSCSGNCSADCPSNCIDGCASDCIRLICRKDAVICPELEPCPKDCNPIACYNCALADTCNRNCIGDCTKDNVRPCEEGPVCTCNTDCPQQFHTDIITPCKVVE